MIILSCNNISLSFGVNQILDQTSFHVQEFEKVGIVGVNSAGKSTLFRIISGELQPDSGEIYTARGCKAGYLEQNAGLDSSNTIWEELLTTYADLIEMEKRLKILEGVISTETDEQALNSRMKEYATLSENFARSGGYEYNSRVKGVLRGLGFEDAQFSLKIQVLSGGQKTRLALAKLLLEEPDLLLLDEPTNHLDIHALEWLEDFLRNYKKSILLISHDRYFLDQVTNKTIELENCECKTYNGNYSAYVRQKSVDREIQRRHYEQQQKEISRMEAFIEQQRRWNREKNIIAAESRQKAIDRMEKIEKPKDLPDKVNIKFRSGIAAGNDILFAENLSKEYPGKPLFKDVSFEIKKNDRVFLLGPNGCGKSTLLKMLAGKLDKTSGSIEYGHKVVPGYYDQEHEDLDERNTIIDEVWDDNDKLTQTQVRNALASFLFKGEDVFKTISVLSGGERARVALVKLMLSEANFLMLDEPTNHLDINSREVLESSLEGFDGTLLVVSHDRYLIQKLATRILELNGNSMVDFHGSYTDYLEYKSRLKQGADTHIVESKMTAAKADRLASKEEKAKQRRQEKQLKETENEIERIEERLSVIETDMTLEEVCSDHVRLTDLVNEQASLKARLDELYELWGELQE